MSTQVTTAFVQQFRANIDLLTQQMGSKLRGSVRIEEQKSEKSFFDRLNSTAAVEITTRHGDSPQVDTPHDRRMVSLRFFDWGDFVDDIDKIRMLADPTSSYAQNAAAAFGRKIDDLLIEGATGTAFSGKDGTTSVAFPAGQLISAGGTGLTVSKLIQARKKFLANDVDLDMPGNDLHIAIDAGALEDLLEDSTNRVTSGDFNTVRALVRGEIDTYMGFKFHHSERLLDGAGGGTENRVIVWARSGLLLSRGVDITTRITERADKRFSTYVYVKMGFGATRMEEVKVVAIDYVV